MDYSSDFCQMSSVFPRWPVRSRLNWMNVLQSDEIRGYFSISIKVSPIGSNKQLHVYVDDIVFLLFMESLRTCHMK